MGEAPPPTTSRSLRIAVLECDTPIGRTKEKYGGYGGLFRELLESGAQRFEHEDGKTRPQLDVRKYDVVNEEVYPELEGLDGVLITGSSEFCPWDTDMGEGGGSGG